MIEKKRNFVIQQIAEQKRAAAFKAANTIVFASPSSSLGILDVESSSSSDTLASSSLVTPLQGGSAASPAADAHSPDKGKKSKKSGAAAAAAKAAKAAEEKAAKEAAEAAAKARRKRPGDDESDPEIELTLPNLIHRVRENKLHTDSFQVRSLFSRFFLLNFRILISRDALGIRLS